MFIVATVILKLLLLFLFLVIDALGLPSFYKK